MKKPKPVYNNITFDSEEEIWFYIYLTHLIEVNIVEWFEYQPASFKLFDEVFDSNGESLLKGRIYTADYKVKFIDDRFKKIHNFRNLDKQNNIAYIDIKGTFIKFGKERFTVNQKIVYDKYKIYIEKIIPQDLMKKTFVVEYARYTEKLKRIRDMYKNTPTFNEWKLNVGV